MISRAEPWLLGVLQSRVLWFAISQIAQPLRERAGLWQYRLIRQFVERLPIPAVSDNDQLQLGLLADQITQLARRRYAIDQSGRHRIATDLGGSTGKLNQKLNAWWTLDFSDFRSEVHKALRQDIPVRDRDGWAEWLHERTQEHRHLTSEIIRHEKSLNDLVYDLFDLEAEEIVAIEESTKYPFGEV